MTEKPKKSRNKKILLAILLVFVLGLVAVAWIHRVDNGLTAADKVTIGHMSQQKEIPALANNPTYEDQIRFIRGVQNAVLHRVSGNKPIAYGKSREPKDLYDSGSGLCYDRSRMIEKILRAHGFRTRHIAIYDGTGLFHPLLALFTPGVESHAVSEVKTKKGWLVVDSNAPWISLDSQDDPVSMRDIRRAVRYHGIHWNQDYVNEMNPIYTSRLVFVYGLYSRHGKFYPPYNFVPDIAWGEFKDNAYKPKFW